MEILKGFSFDIQRHGSNDITFIAAGSDQGDTLEITNNASIYYNSDTGKFTLAGDSANRIASVGTRVLGWVNIPEGLTGLTVKFEADSLKPVMWHSKVTFSDDTGSFKMSNGNVGYIVASSVFTPSSTIEVTDGTPKLGRVVDASFSGANAKGVSYNVKFDRTKPTVKISEDLEITLSGDASANVVTVTSDG